MSYDERKAPLETNETHLNEPEQPASETSELHETSAAEGYLETTLDSSPMKADQTLTSSSESVSSKRKFTGSIRIKILAGFLTIVLLLVASASYTLTQVRRMAVDTAHLLEQEIIVYQLYQEMTLAISERSSLISNYVLTGTRSYLDSFYQISAVSDEMIERLKELSDRPEDMEFIERSLAWRRMATGEVIPLYVNGRHEEAAKVVSERMAPEGTQLIQQAKLISESRQQEFLATGDALMRAQNRVVNLIGVAIAAAVLIAAALALIVSNRITRPLKQVLAAANAVAEGDLRQEVPVMSNDETGQLAVAVNQMIISLKGLIKSSDFISEQVASTSEELAATAEEAAASSEEVAKTIHEVSRATGEQATSVEDSNRGMNSIAGHLQQVTASIDEVLNGSRTTLASAESGRGAARKAVDTMSQIRTATDETAASVKALDQASREIVKIVDSIGAIADQTNLLALNAAIEAARAGDAGRGFAVVADEIRKLAEQSSQSSSQIATIIDGIQKQIHEAVASMEANNEKVISGTGIVNEASSHFESILEEINHITQQIDQVTDLVREVNAHSGTVVGHFESMSAVSEETAASAQQVSASAEEQTAAINEIAESSTELASLSQELRNAIAVFKY
ncbi:methyl-accepting chemotaxis protein [Anoxynatronum sibiricum]|uniref:Methyl-accepting chemotaxis protein n=1 Tax=Anoxynatronum sibiricum TaxID=210623 RepID=A0ABU9VUP6_9CLOT